MGKLQIVFYPSALLRKECKKITRVDGAVRKLAQDMLETMYAANGVGLAAPQVGQSRRLMVVDVSGEEESRKPFVFIDPEITEFSGEITELEGCLSFPGVYFEVKRHNKVKVKYKNLSGKQQKLTAEGDLLSRAIQHELDHLNGELFIDKPANKIVADLEMTKHGFMGETVEIERGASTS
jgi:peptide deformylase